MIEKHVAYSGNKTLTLWSNIGHMKSRDSFQDFLNSMLMQDTKIFNNFG